MKTQEQYCFHPKSSRDKAARVQRTSRVLETEVLCWCFDSGIAEKRTASIRMFRILRQFCWRIYSAAWNLVKL